MTHDTLCLYLQDVGKSPPKLGIYVSTKVHDVTSHRHHLQGVKCENHSDEKKRQMPKQSFWTMWNKLLEYQMWNLPSLIPHAMYCSASALTQLDGVFVLLHSVKWLSVIRRFRINSKKRLWASSYPSVRMYKQGSHWTDLREILYSRVEKL
jgi:hypothetical protein